MQIASQGVHLVLGEISRNVREAHITSAKREVVSAGVQGPLKGPGSSGGLDAFWCNLSPILGAFSGKYFVFSDKFIVKNAR